MPHTELDAQYWNQRYLAHSTPWDAGAATPPIVRYFEGLADKDLRILVPGAGNAHEALHLHDAGFRQVWICDWAEAALAQVRARRPDFPAERLILADFFQLDMAVDILVEQTFFCALPPSLRPQYVAQAHRLLAASGGYVVGLLFGLHFAKAGPPFGGDAAEYRRLFEPFFHIHTLAPCYNSIAPRLGNELFVKFLARSA